jgi:hypothetical protein
VSDCASAGRLAKLSSSYTGKYSRPYSKRGAVVNCVPSLESQNSGPSRHSVTPILFSGFIFSEIHWVLGCTSRDRWPDGIRLVYDEAVSGGNLCIPYTSYENQATTPQPRSRNFWRKNVVFHSPLLATAEYRLDDRNTFLRWKGKIEVPQAPRRTGFHHRPAEGIVLCRRFCSIGPESLVRFWSYAAFQFPFRI